MPVLACGKEGAGRQWGTGAEECVREGRSSEDIQRIRKVRVVACSRRCRIADHRLLRNLRKICFLGGEFYDQGRPRQ